MDLQTTIAKLRSLGQNSKPGYREGMTNFGIKSDNALGVQLPKIRALAKYIGTDHKLALELWKQNIHEAKLLATMIDNPKLVSENQMDEWVRDFNSWDICDQCCSNLFDQTKFYEKKIFEWVESDLEFIRRAGFVLMATSAVHHKKESDEKFITYLPIIKKYSTDERNFVKKAANWALRQIGKRSPKLMKEANTVAQELKNSDDATARWIGSDALREFEKKKLGVRG